MDRSISAESRRAKRMLQLTRALVYAVLIFLSFLCLFSFYMLIINATRSNADLQGGFRLIPSDQFFINLKNAWTDASIDIPRGMLNSFFIASVSALLSTYFSALTAYGIHAYNFRLKKAAFTFIMAVMVIPNQVYAVGFYQMCVRLGWTNSYIPLILPGIAARETVYWNHNAEFIASSFARTGILEGNPLHRDMVAAAELAKLAFIVNVVIDEEKKTVAAFAGDFRKAHEAGVAFLRPYCEVKAVPGDIVITSNGGAPLDQNIYQSVKGLTAAEASAKEGAVLIMCADLADGTGGEGFYQSLKNCESPAAHFAQCAATPQDETIPDQWESQILARILMKHRVIFVSRPEMETTLREMKLDYAPNLETALAMAKQDKGEAAEITIIPNGISVMVKN